MYILDCNYNTVIEKLYSAVLTCTISYIQMRFISFLLICRKNIFKITHNCYEFCKEIDCCYFTNDVELI